MCNPASFVLTKDRIFWSKTSDSHEDIIREHRLHADGAQGPNIVRVEITPPKAANFALPAAQWKYTVDQDELPPWYNDEEAESRVRAELPEWLKEKVVLPGETRKLVTEGNILAVYGTVGTLRESGVIDRVYAGGVVEAVRGTALIRRICAGGRVNSLFGEGSRILQIDFGGVLRKLSGRSAVLDVYGKVGTVMGEGIIERLHPKGIVECLWGHGLIRTVEPEGLVKGIIGNGQVGMNRGIVVDIWGDGIVVEVRAGGKVKRVSGSGKVLSVFLDGDVEAIHESGTVTTFTSLPVSILKSKNAVLIDRSKDTVVVHTGQENI